MSDLTPKSCTTKIKQWWIDFYKSPYFWIKCISATIILGLAAFGFFKIITSAFYYFSEPLSYFDPERLGQLGDFLGGTLNPIFGFATVCLLLWSIFIQRKELSLTRDELSKSATALGNQVKLATDEYNRKQIDESLNKLYTLLENLYGRHIKDGIQTTLKTPSFTTEISINSLKSIPEKSPEEKEAFRKKIDDILSKIDTHQDINLFNINSPQELLASINLLLSYTSELLQELMKITNINSIKKSRLIEIEEILEKFRSINAISNETYTKLLNPIKFHVKPQDI